MYYLYVQADYVSSLQNIYPSLVTVLILQDLRLCPAGMNIIIEIDCLLMRIAAGPLSSLH